jgi:hypothetical protein
MVLLCLHAAPAVLAVDNEGSLHPQPPLREGSVPKSFTWDNDKLITSGSVEGGISIDYDTSGNLYAVRCTDGGDCTIYKSTNGGTSWFILETAGKASGINSPVILTGSTGNKLYLFLMNPDQNGTILVERYTENGTWEGIYPVKFDSDTITYYSACTDLGKGDHLMVVYQKEEMGDDTPDLYTITSTDYGETWGNEVLAYAHGSHPDIAYGRNGYVYLVFEWFDGSDYEIGFIRSTNYCSPGSWVDLKALTTNSYDDTYPKVAALHTLPDSTPYVFVAYNQDNLPSTDIDLAYAYSWNGGKDWDKDNILDSTSVWNEMACDLWTKRSPDYNYVHVCYFVGRYVLPFPQGHIHYGSASETNPTDWGWLFSPTNHWPTQSEDGRKVCQGTFAPGNYGFMGPAIMYAGKDPDNYSGDNFRNLYFDNSAWPVDVEEGMTEEEAPAGFSLSSNYPNPFNPITSIQYTVQGRQTPLRTTLKIYNIRGQRVRTLVDEPNGRGTHRVVWDGRSDEGKAVASGVYLYELRVGDFSQTKKMVLMR